MTFDLGDEYAREERQAIMECELEAEQRAMAAGGPSAPAPLAGDGSQPQALPGDPREVDGLAVSPPRPAAPVAIEWPSATADFCLLLGTDDLPAAPFWLNRWTEVVDAGKLLRWLRADILRGPSGPRARHGILQRELMELRRFALAAHG